MRIGHKVFMPICKTKTILFLLGVNHFTLFLRFYPDLICAVKLCVLNLADQCLSKGLISECVYEQITKRTDWVDTDKARCLLDNIRTLISVTPQVLDIFLSVLFQEEDCKLVAKKLQLHLQ